MKFNLLFLLALLPALVWAREPKSDKDGAPKPPAPSVSNCLVGTARAELDINNVRTLLLNGGDMWWEPNTSTARYEIPKTVDNSEIRKHSLYAASIWVGGNEQGTNNRFIMAMTYRGSTRRSYWPGPIDSLTQFTNQARCRGWDKMFKINRSDVEDFIQRYKTGGISSIDDVPEPVRLLEGKRLEAGEPTTDE